MTAIEVVGLRKSYGSFEAVKGVTFSVEEGEVLAVVGPNGAGKTTTVEILEGYLARDAGSVTVLGMDPAHGGGELLISAIARLIAALAEFAKAIRWRRR